jgi:hypothetical protein
VDNQRVEVFVYGAYDKLRRLQLAQIHMNLRRVLIRAESQALSSSSGVSVQRFAVERLCGNSIREQSKEVPVSIACFLSADAIPVRLEEMELIEDNS